MTHAQTDYGFAPRLYDGKLFRVYGFSLGLVFSLRWDRSEDMIFFCFKYISNT